MTEKIARDGELFAGAGGIARALENLGKESALLGAVGLACHRLGLPGARLGGLLLLQA